MLVTRQGVCSSSVLHLLCPCPMADRLCIREAFSRQILLGICSSSLPHSPISGSWGRAGEHGEKMLQTREVQEKV